MAWIKTAHPTKCSSFSVDLACLYDKHGFGLIGVGGMNGNLFRLDSIPVVPRHYNSARCGTRGIIVLLSAPRTTKYLTETPSIRW